MGNDPSPIAATRPSWMGLARKAKRLDVVSLHLASLHARGDSDRSEADCVCEGGQACLVLRWWPIASSVWSCCLEYRCGGSRMAWEHRRSCAQSGIEGYVCTASAPANHWTVLDAAVLSCTYCTHPAHSVGVQTGRIPPTIIAPRVARRRASRSATRSDRRSDRPSPRW
jgi:hypothetical protein